MLAQIKSCVQIDYKNINTEWKKSTNVHSKLKQTTLLNQEQ